MSKVWNATHCTRLRATGQVSLDLSLSIYLSIYLSTHLSIHLYNIYILTRVRVPDGRLEQALAVLRIVGRHHLRDGGSVLEGNMGENGRASDEEQAKERHRRGRDDPLERQLRRVQKQSPSNLSK